MTSSLYLFIYLFVPLRSVTIQRYTCKVSTSSASHPSFLHEVYHTSAFGRDSSTETSVLDFLLLLGQEDIRTPSHNVRPGVRFQDVFLVRPTHSSDYVDDTTLTLLLCVTRSPIRPGLLCPQTRHKVTSSPSVTSQNPFSVFGD